MNRLTQKTQDGVTVSLSCGSRRFLTFSVHLLKMLLIYIVAIIFCFGISWLIGRCVVRKFKWMDRRCMLLIRNFNWMDRTQESEMSVSDHDKKLLLVLGIGM